MMIMIVMVVMVGAAPEGLGHARPSKPAPSEF